MLVSALVISIVVSDDAFVVMICIAQHHLASMYSTDSMHTHDVLFRHDST